MEWLYRKFNFYGKRDAERINRLTEENKKLRERIDVLKERNDCAVNELLELYKEVCNVYAKLEVELKRSDKQNEK